MKKIWSKYVNFERHLAHLQTPKSWTRLHNYYDSPAYEKQLKVWVVVSVIAGVYVGYEIYKYNTRLDALEFSFVPQEWDYTPPADDEEPVWDYQLIDELRELNDTLDEMNRESQ